MLAKSFRRANSFNCVRCLSTEHLGRMSSFHQQAKEENENLTRFYLAVKKVSNQKIRFPPEEQAEHERIGKEYQRQSVIRTNQLNKDLTNKIWLQQDAIRALPAHLVEHAKTTDHTPPPPDRPWPFYDTPPIRGFNGELFQTESAEKSNDEDD